MTESNAAHDRFEGADMVVLVTMCRDVIARGANGYSFCCMLQFDTGMIYCKVKVKVGAKRYRGCGRAGF